jgi:hypothetical protein
MNLKGKGSQAKNRYNRELESYKWFVVNLKENKAITGYEFKSDALDVLSDYDDRSRYKVVSEISLKKLGIENPKEMWKYKYDNGGSIDLFEDYDNIPANVQKVLDKYEDAFMDGDYEGLREAKKEVNKIGYTFNFDMDGTAYGLKPLNKMAKGGGVGNENALMVANNNKQIYHHTKEMSEALKGTKNVPAWVVAKVNRSASDLSDATHYLEGAEGMYADGGGVEDNLNKKYLNSIPEDKKQRILRNVADHYGISIKDAEKEVTDIESEALYEYITNESLRMEVYNGMENRKFSDIGELENLTPVELYFRNLDYSKLPESFSNFIKTEILTDPELKYLSEREPIFIEIKEKVEKYENQNSGKVEEAEEESIGDLIAGLEVLVPISTKKEKKELLDLIEGLKLLL